MFAGAPGQATPPGAGRFLQQVGVRAVLGVLAAVLLVLGAFLGSCADLPRRDEPVTPLPPVSIPLTTTPVGVPLSA
jgi:hypothetical protein